MGIPSVTTNLSGFGCFMQDLIERPQDEGCYIVDRRSQSVEDSVNQLTDNMFSFVSKTRRQRINQRNRVERLSPLLDWKNLGIEYSKARQLALRRAYPDSFYGANGESEEDEFEFSGMERMMPNSVPASPRFRMTGIATPGDLGTLTEEVSIGICLYCVLQEGSSICADASVEHERLPWHAMASIARRGGRRLSIVRRHSISPTTLTNLFFLYSPLVMKVRSRASSILSGASTPGGGRSKSLSEHDLRQADAALSNVSQQDGIPATTPTSATTVITNGVNGRH